MSALRTRAGEGWDRRGFSVAEIFAMQKIGLFDADPGAEGYGQMREVGAEGTLTLPFEPALTIRVADLG